MNTKVDTMENKFGDLPIDNSSVVSGTPEFALGDQAVGGTCGLLVGLGRQMFGASLRKELGEFFEQLRLVVEEARLSWYTCWIDFFSFW